jgi:predicted O-methyltransferase YrrM
MKLLVTLLSSSGLHFLKESYKSVKNQLPVKFKYDIVIIINTLNDEYYKQVKNDKLLKTAKIIRTESNGYPGKGHNSARKYFKKNKKRYDYLFTIDGDDFLYNWAFQRLEHYLKYKPDVLCLMFHDRLHIQSNNTIQFTIHNNINSKKLWYTVKSNSPFNNPIYECDTPGRIILYSQNSLKEIIKYDENVTLYDDYYPFIQILEYSVLNKLKIFNICDSDIYIYNKINNNSASSTFFKDKSKFENEEKIFKKSLENKFLAIKDFDLTKIPVLQLDQIDNKRKTQICNILINNFNTLITPSSASIKLNLTKKYLNELTKNIDTEIGEYFTPQGKIDLSKNVGIEHYKLFAGISKQYINCNILEIGTHHGNSAVALGYGLLSNNNIKIKTYDIKPFLKPECKLFFGKFNIKYNLLNLFDEDIREKHKEYILSNDIIFIDIDPHEGVLEYEMYCWLKNNDFNGLILFDDIKLGLGHIANGYRETKNTMIEFWNKIDNKYKIDLTHIGHHSGTGLVCFNQNILNNIIIDKKKITIANNNTLNVNQKKYSIMVFGQFRSYKANLEKNLKDIYETFIKNNIIDVYILTDKKSSGNYSKENENEIINIFKKYNCNIVFIKYWEDLPQYHHQETINNLQYMANCKHTKGKNNFTSNLWYRRYILNELKNDYKKKYDLDMFIRLFDIKLKPLKNDIIIKDQILSCINTPKLLMSIDTIFIGNKTVIDNLFSFGKEFNLYHDDIWDNKQLCEYLEQIDQWLYNGKYTYCSEIQFFSHIFNSDFKYQNIRLDYNNLSSPFNKNALFDIRLDNNRFNFINSNKHLLVTTTYKNNFTLLELFYKFYKTIWNPSNFLFIVGNTDETKDKNIGIFNKTLGIQLLKLHDINFPEFPTVKNSILYKADNIYVFIYDTLPGSLDQTIDFLLENLHNGLKNIGHPIFEHKYYINVDSDDFLYTINPQKTLESNINTYNILNNIDDTQNIFTHDTISSKYLDYKNPLLICSSKQNNKNLSFDIQNIIECCFSFNNVNNNNDQEKIRINLFDDI